MTKTKGKPPLDDEELGPRMGGIALKNGLILLTERHWAAAIREEDGSINVASGKKARLPGSGESEEAARSGAAADAAPRQGPAGLRGGGGALRASRGSDRRRTRMAPDRPVGVPVVRGLERFAETVLVLGTVKRHLPNARLPLEGGRVLAALTAALAAGSAVKAFAPKSAVVQETGAALASFVPAVLALKGSAISGYHGAEHKVIGGREAALRAAAAREKERWAESGAAGEAGGKVGGEAGGKVGGEASGKAGSAGSGAAPAVAGASTSAIITGDSAAAAKEHDRCGTNLVGPYLLATVVTNILARGRSGAKTPAASAAAGAASLGLALEALRWASKHGDSILARLMLSPGRLVQKTLTTTEPTAEQLEVGERALTELMRLETAGA